MNLNTNFEHKKAKRRRYFVLIVFNNGFRADIAACIQLKVENISNISICMCANDVHHSMRLIAQPSLTKACSQIHNILRII